MGKAERSLMLHCIRVFAANQCTKALTRGEGGVDLSLIVYAGMMKRSASTPCAPRKRRFDARS
jgi:hypothetical protein